MNTLKLKLLAASMFACSAAFAQGTAASGQTNNSPSSNGQLSPLSGPTSNANAFTPTAAQGVGMRNDINNYSVDSYVLQSGSNQYAKVNQQGYYNTADIYQTGGSGNNATQSQLNDGRDNFQGKRNTAYIAQGGSASSANQSQTGTGNVASTIQGQGSGNFADQKQDGMSHSAEITQAGSTSNATQSQTDGNSDVARIVQGAGTNNTADQKQFGGSNNSADISQDNGGSFNDAYQSQQGSSNAARIQQDGSSRNYAEQHQVGTGNQASTTQSAAQYGSFSYIGQTGTSNQATVTQVR
ncbi:hypothetical protein [Hymenobacter arcticus]